MTLASLDGQPSSPEKGEKPGMTKEDSHVHAPVVAVTDVSTRYTRFTRRKHFKHGPIRKTRQ